MRQANTSKYGGSVEPPSFYKDIETEKDSIHNKEDEPRHTKNPTKRAPFKHNLGTLIRQT